MAELQDMPLDVLLVIAKQTGIRGVGDIGRLAQVHTQLRDQLAQFQQHRKRRLNLLSATVQSWCQAPFINTTSIKQVWISDEEELADGGGEWVDMVALHGPPPLDIVMNPFFQWWLRQKDHFSDQARRLNGSVSAADDEWAIRFVREQVMDEPHVWPGEFLVDRLNYGIERGEGRMPEGYVTPRNPRTIQ